MSYSSSTAFNEPFEAPGVAAAFFLVIGERLLRLVVVHLALGLLRLGRLLLRLELVVVQVPVPGQRLRPDDELRRDPAREQLGVVELVLVEAGDLEDHRLPLHAPHAFELPRDLALLLYLVVRR